VSELIGTTALIAHLNDRGAAAFNGKFCRIEAFDPHVRRYVVKVYADEGPVTAKLRLENLILPGTTAPVAPVAAAPVEAAMPEALPEGMYFEGYNPWTWPPSAPSLDPFDPLSWSMGGGAMMPWPYGADAMDAQVHGPCLPMTSLPPLSTTPLTCGPSGGLPFSPPMAEQPLPVPLPPFPVDQPVTVHTHQVLEQQLIQEHTQNQKLLTPKSDPHQPPLDDAPPEPLAEPPPEPDEGPKRRRRRRGKRKSQKTGAEPAESEASSHAGDAMDADDPIPGSTAAAPVAVDPPWRPQLPATAEPRAAPGRSTEPGEGAEEAPAPRPSATSWRPSLSFARSPAP
ncbi:Uridine-cytidine kinase A, partial [Durusdinium trenchii]